MAGPTPSPELLAVARRWYKAVTRRGITNLESFISTGDVLRFVGSAEGETWFGPAVRNAISDHFNEIPNVLETEEIIAEAFENGATGWTFFVHKFRFETRDEPLVFYSSLIFALEDNSWKIVHRHASIPTPNMEATGHEHTAIQALVDAAQDGFSLGQREGLASVMFTDIVNSSTLATAMGDRAWSGIISAHFADLRGVVEAHDGQFVKSLGDGTMSSFPSARQALSAAQAIQTALADSAREPNLSVRIGLHTGDVVQSDDDFFGSVVNMAARITATAEPGTILVSDVTRAMVGSAPDFAFSARAPVPLKGFDGMHQTHVLDWRS